MSTGVNAGDNTAVTISNSVVSQAVTTGLVAQKNGTINIESCEVANNNVGILAGQAASIIRLFSVGIFDNTTGIASGFGKIISFGSNRSAGNTNASAPVGQVAIF